MAKYGDEGQNELKDRGMKPWVASHISNDGCVY